MQIKDNYVKRIRRPFEVIYIFTILLLLACIILYFEASLLNLVAGTCIVALMVELVNEKHMQNRLLGINLATVAKIFLTPEQVRWEIARLSPKTHAFSEVKLQSPHNNAPLKNARQKRFFFYSFLAAAALKNKTGGL